MSDAAENLDDQEMERKSPGFFAPAYLAKQFREVAVDFIEVDHQMIRTRWFQTNHDVDLFVWLDERGNVIKQQLTLCGQVVEWNLLDGLRTGMLIQEEVKTEEVVTLGEPPETGPCSESIVYDRKGPDKMSVRQALDLLRATTCIEAVVLEDLVRNLTTPRSLREWPQEEILLKFGKKSRRRQNAQTLLQRLSTLASKLKSWLPQRE